MTSDHPGQAGSPHRWRFWDPVIGCEALSPGCRHCRAATAVHCQAVGSHDDPEGRIGKRALTSTDGRWTGEVWLETQAVGLPLGWREPSGVVLGSLSDLFHPKVEASTIGAIFEVVASTPHLTYVMLTKRSKRMLHLGNEGLAFPSNLWIGVSVESDDFAWRAEDLLRLNAASTWVAVEPMLAPVPSLPVAGLGWVVCAPESGPDARPLDTSWVRQLRDACTGAGVPFHFGALPDAQSLPLAPPETPLLDGRTWVEAPFAL